MPKGWLLALGVVLFQAAAQGNEILVALTNQVWRYEQSGIDLTGTGWELPNYDDRSWLTGRGVFAYETSPSVTLVNNVYAHTNTVLPSPAPVVCYFRTHFTFSGNPAYTVLVLSNLVDDGYVLFLNGAEVSVFNMNAPRTLAAQPLTPEGVYFVTNLCAPNDTLQEGTNLLAVAVYQSSFISADVVWGAVLHASPVVIPQIISPTNTVDIWLLEGRSTNLTVSAGNIPCQNYQWFFDSNAIPGATSPTYTIENMDAAKAGTYYAAITTRAGTSRSSDFIVSLVMDHEPPRITSASGDPWDLTRVTVTFSEDVIDVLNNFEPFLFHIENALDPNANYILANSVTYGALSNVLILSLWEPRDPATRYRLVIDNDGIEDRFGNRLFLPIAYMTVPTVVQDGLLGYLGTQDTELRQATPDEILGNNTNVLCDAMPLSHGLLRFENFCGGAANQMPCGAWVTKATLRLFTEDPSSGATPVRMLRMLVPWDESSTWNSLSNGIDQTNGMETGITETLIFATNDNRFVEVDVTEALQAWYMERGYGWNYGWAFVPTATDGWRWASSEHPIDAQRPALILEFDLHPPYCLFFEQPQSQTVRAGSPFTLTAVATGGSDVRYQWYKNNAVVPGAIASSYSVNRARPSDSGNYFIIIQNDLVACTSAVASVTVVCETNPIQLLSAVGNVDGSTITLSFNDVVDREAATNLTNYALSGGLNIIGLTYSGTQVTLTNSGLRQFGRNYILTVRNLGDDSGCSRNIYPNPTVAPLTQEVRLASFDAVWKYENTGLDLGTAWRLPQYDDSTWWQGPGLLGFETQADTLAALSNQNLFIQTPLRRTHTDGNPIITDYFRTLVNVPFETTGVTFTIRHVVDDGAVFYFNGAEVARFNMPTGVINAATVAPNAPSEGVVRSITGVTGLSPGWNSVAVEVHQTTPVSNDVLLGVELIARVPQFAGRLAIEPNPDGTVTISWVPESALLEAAPGLGGPWTDVEGAVNPLRVSVESGNRFYRLR